MEDDQLFRLIKKYLEGSCTPQEKIQIENWYEQQESNEDAFYENDSIRISDSSGRSLDIIKAEILEYQLANRKSRILN